MYDFDIKYAVIIDGIRYEVSRTVKARDSVDARRRFLYEMASIDFNIVSVDYQ